MEPAEDSNPYEQLRKRNVERNEEFLWELGLYSPRVKGSHAEKEDVLGKNCQRSKKVDVAPRRSGRLACLQQSSSEHQRAVAGLKESESCEEKIGAEEKLFNDSADRQLQEYSSKDVMEDFNDARSGGEEYSTDTSSDSVDEVPVGIECSGSKPDTALSAANVPGIGFPGMSSFGFAVESGSMGAAAGFGAQLQEFMFRALFQATGALIGTPSLGHVSSQAGFTTPPFFTGGPMSQTSMWKETAFNREGARRRRKTPMSRTSAGEDSDSQQDFPILENETPQQKSLRTRRLNRFRTRRASELTNNRKAMNKLPYVLHVDVMGKAKGIHRHQWRAAVRGQCGRLDPSMDNINHHSKQVVDSIWHALQKEWEFEGFAHRAREMFEKAATKCMRNRKMQLKYKCQKSLEFGKPEDIRGTHWDKIKDITLSTMKQSNSSPSMQSTHKGKEKLPANEEHGPNSSLQLQSLEEGSRRYSPDVEGVTEDSGFPNEDVDARIRNLENELMRLQNSKKGALIVKDANGTRECNENWKVAVVTECETDNMKENAKPSNLDSEVKQSFSGKGRKDVQVNYKSAEKRSAVSVDALRQEMDCGDVVRLLAIVGGMKKEIGKGIVMGLAGSKHTRKVISNGWRSVKVTSYTSVGFSEPCPVPSGWVEHTNQRTLKKASGRTILWPDTLLQSLVLL